MSEEYVVICTKEKEVENYFNLASAQSKNTSELVQKMYDRFACNLLDFYSKDEIGLVYDRMCKIFREVSPIYKISEDFEVTKQSDYDLRNLTIEDKLD